MVKGANKVPNDKVYTVAEDTSLLPYLIQLFPNKGRNKVKAMLTHRQVKVEGKVVTRHDHVLLTGQHVSILAVGEAGKDVLQGVRILHEDADIIVIDKPAGLLSMATDEEREKTAYRILTDYVRRIDTQARIFIVHRLDKETSGVMMFAKREGVQQALQNDWKNVVQERAYVVLVEGQVRHEKGTIHSWLKESQTKTMYVSRAKGDGQEAITHYEVLQAGKDYSLLQVHLETGRKNQIRVHMQSIGHSVVGDRRYGSTKNPIGRLGLHARTLAFLHPTHREVVRFSTDIPSAFRRVFATGNDT